MSSTSSTIGSGGGGGVGRGGMMVRSPLTPQSELSPHQTMAIYGSVPGPSVGGSHHHHQQQQQSSGSGRLITISVVGWSGTEKEKGSVGVGKSCLCNRFVRPLEDDYRADHISTLSQVDFGGRVINNDHWLYWGDRTVFGDDASELTFRILEQTEFVDDESFQPLKASNASQREPYVKRCSATRLQSPDKLMYIAKEQLGIEHEYEQRQLPEGKASIDGFICVFDVGAGANHYQNNSFNNDSSPSPSSSSRQTEFVAQVLQNALKTRKPVVLVTTKNDESDERQIRDVEKLLSSKKEFKNSIPLVETSSHKNVNVESAFMLLASLIERQQQSSNSKISVGSSSSNSSKFKILNFHESAKNRREVLDVAAAAYLQKLRSTTKDDHRYAWMQICRQLAEDPDFVHFVELCGTQAAMKLFRQHSRELKERYAQRRLQSQMGRLPEAIPVLLPEIGVLRGKNWQDVLQNIQNVPHFDEYFQPLGYVNPSDYSGDRSLDYALSSSPAISDEDPRIPAELLYTQEAEQCFRRHLGQLESEYRRQKMQDEFAQLIAQCSQVTPGKPLADVKIFFLGKECFEALPEGDLQIIYERYQNQLIKRARRDFLELLQEQVDEFVNRALLRSKSKRQSANNVQQQGAPASSSSASGNPRPAGELVAMVGPPRTAQAGMNERDMRELHEKLQEDARYRLLNRLHQSRDNLIGQYISFVTHPLRQYCPAHPRCMDTLVEQLLANQAHRPLSWNQDDRSPRKNQTSRSNDPQSILFPPPVDRRINLLVLGMDGLAEQVIRELRAFLQSDLFQHRGTQYTFDYRSIESDDAWIASTSAQFRPNGLICAFSSRASLDYARGSIARALQHSSQDHSTPASTATNRTLENLPVVLMFAFDASNLDDLPYLQQQGNRLGDEYRCSFVGLEPSSRNIGHVTQDRRVAASNSPSLFTVEQLNRALASLVQTAVQRGGSTNGQGGGGDPNPDDRKSDAKLSLCLMCGDEYAPELILAPLLNYQCPAPQNGQSASTSSTNQQQPASKNNIGHQSKEEFLGNGGGNDQSSTNTFFVETFSPGSARKLRYEVDVAAYHTAFLRISEHRYSHGYILVYSAKRRASLAHLHSLAHLIPDPIPILVVAVGEVTEFFSDPATNSLITEGNEVADRMGARFITISKAAEQQFSIYTSFFDEVWTNASAVEAAGFSTNPIAENGSTNRPGSAGSGHYAPLSDFLSGTPQQHQLPRENHWYGDISMAISNNLPAGSGGGGGGIRAPTHPVLSTFQQVSTTTNGSANLMGQQRPPPPPYGSTIGSTGFDFMVTGEIFASEPTSADSCDYERRLPSASTPTPRSINEYHSQHHRSSMSRRSSRPPILPSHHQQHPPTPRHRFGSSGDESEVLMMRRGPYASRPRHAASATDIHEMMPHHYHHGKKSTGGNGGGRRRIGGWKKAFMGWWESGSDGTLNRQLSHQPPSSAKPPSVIGQPGSDKLQRSGSAVAASQQQLQQQSSPRQSGSPSSLKQQQPPSNSRNQQAPVKKSGRINLQNFTSNVTDSISSKFAGGGKKSTTSTPASGGAISPQLPQAFRRDELMNATAPAPLATPESIELGSEYMTVKDALGGCAWPSSTKGNTESGEFYGDDEQQYATVDSILLGAAGTHRTTSVPPARPPRRSDSSGAGEKTTSTLDSTSSGDSSSAQSSVYERTGRKPTPHRSKTGRQGHRSTSSGELASGIPAAAGDGQAGMSIAERVRQLNAALELNRSQSPPAPAIPPYSNDRMVTVSKRIDTAHVLAQRRSASEESLLDPFLFERRSRPPIFALQKNGQRVVFDDDYEEEGYHEYYGRREAQPPRGSPEYPEGAMMMVKKRSPAMARIARRSKTTNVDSRLANAGNGGANGGDGAGFVRKVTSSFRFRRKKSTDAGESRSTPQSPLLSGQPPEPTTAAGHHRVFVLPPFETSLMWNSNADGHEQSDGQVVSTSWWGGSKITGPSISRSPKKDSTVTAPDKVPLTTVKDRKISKEQKKSTVEAPASRITGNKKKSRESSQTQLVPPDATLKDLAAAEDDPVPMYVQKCVDFIEATGLQTEGIYRVPGNQAHVVQLEQKYLDDPSVSFYDLDLPVNAVATSLKNFFSSLSEPVVPYNLYDDLMEAMSIRQSDVRQERVRQVLQRLSPENRAVLRYFVDHLRRVAQNFETTAMDHRNLAKCWWPTLLRPQFDSFETMTQMTQRLEEFVQIILENPNLLN